MSKNKLSNSEWMDYYIDKYHLERTKVLKKKAAQMDDIYSLLETAENVRNAGAITWENVVAVRGILGQIMRNVNDISRVYKMGARGHDVRSRAQELLRDVNNFDDLREAAQELFTVLQSTSASEGENVSQVQRGTMHLMSMLQNLMSMSFTPQQVAVFNQITAGRLTTQMSHAEEVNVRRMQSFLKGAIYSTKNEEDQTRKVIRETLQNAVDASTKLARERPGHEAEVRLYTSVYGDYNNRYMDLTIVDNGTGMDLETLSKNFYVYFQSGKEDDEDSAGGFGIAKAVIQETPQEGWSLETNDIGSSSFHKNMYLGARLDEGYQHPTLQTNRQGTQLTLYHLPYLYDSAIKNICSKYATGTVNIYLNDELVEPVFEFSAMQRIDSSGEGIISAIADNDAELEIAQKIVSDKQSDIEQNHLGGYEWNFKGANGEEQHISVSFYVMRIPSESYGHFYVRINGQYQYETSYIPQCNIVCEIQTNIRPNDEYYPMDPGRENLRSPVKETVEKARQTIEKLVKDITENEIFKEGLDIFIYNKDKSPMSTASSDSWEKQERRSRFAERMYDVGAASAQLFTQKEAEAKDASAAVAEMAEMHPEMTSRQQTMLGNVAEAFQREKGVVDVREFMDDVIDILETPCEVVVQKNFVSDEVAHEDIDLTSTLAVLWQKVLKIIVEGSRPFAMGAVREFIPGLIYSDKAIALYSPRNPKVGRDYDTISINPMFVASIVKPELFEDYLADKQDTEMEQGRETIAKDETPINRLSVFLFHEAIHEVTHLLFPDAYSFGHDEFHSWVSKLENVNHFNFQAVRTEVKRYMPQLKRDTDKLIRRIRKDKKRMEGE